MLYIPFVSIQSQKYLDEAEEDKKRYVEELKAYQQSEQYQAFIKRQTAKRSKQLTSRFCYM